MEKRNECVFHSELRTAHKITEMNIIIISRFAEHIEYIILIFFHEY